MNRFQKAIQIIKLRRFILAQVGKGNYFRPGAFATSAGEIGNNNYFGDRAMVGFAKIGNYCSFAPDVKIAQAQHDISYITTYQRICSRNTNYSLLRSKTIIGNDVWIGANAVIMQGVHIGNGAVIGANAVVTKDIPPYAIAVGVPASVIKYRFNPKIIEIIENSEWWNNDYIDACDIVAKLDADIQNIKE